MEPVGKPGPVATSGKAIASLLLGLASFCFAIFTGIPAILLGALALRDISMSQGKVGGTPLAIVGLIAGTISIPWTCISVALLLPAVGAAREAARRMESSNNLKQVGFAMHNYHDTYNSLPLAGSNDPQFGVQQSWRARLLPYIEEAPRYDRFDFNEPWDSANNRQFIEPLPGAYRSPNYMEDPTKTIYLAVVGPDDTTQPEPVRGPYQAAMSSDPRRRTGFREVVDGTSNTILAVEADTDQAVIWSKPADLEFDPENPRRGLGNLRPGGFMAVLADGSVRFIPNSIDDETLRQLLSQSDGNPIDPNVFQE